MSTFAIVYSQTHCHNLNLAQLVEDHPVHPIVKQMMLQMQDVRNVVKQRLEDDNAHYMSTSNKHRRPKEFIREIW